MQVHAQDPHFSQYHASPLTLNPALTGFTDGDARLQFNFRNQFWGIGKPFNTRTISYDSKLQSQTINEHHQFGWGVMGMYDYSMGGAYQNINIGVSGSYHNFFDEDSHHSLGVGFQTVFSTRRINIEGLHFASQFTQDGYDPTLPNMEVNIMNTKNYFDLNAGLIYSYADEVSDFYAGTSLFHINGPNTSFQTNQNYTLPLRWAFHLGGHFNTNEFNKNKLYYSGALMFQGSAQEVIGGLAYGFGIGDYEEKNYFIVGTWYRLKESFIPYIGLDYKQYKIGLTYDIIPPAITIVSPVSKSFELSLNYYINNNKNPYNYYQRGRF